MAYYSLTDGVTTVSVRHMAVLTIQPPQGIFTLRVILIIRKREILTWFHSTHSFSKKFSNGFSAKYFPTVTIDFNFLSLFKPQSCNDTLIVDLTRTLKKHSFIYYESPPIFPIKSRTNPSHIFTPFF